MNLDSRCYHEGWDARTTATLSMLGVKTWGDLAALSEGGLLKVKGFGRVQLTEVKRRMRQAGVEFRGERAVTSVVLAPEPQPICGVYFMACGQYVKIGFGRNIRKRLKQIAISNPHPVDLVGYIVSNDPKSARALEKQLHDRFRAHRHRLEWFHYVDEIQEFVGTLG